MSDNEQIHLNKCLSHLYDICCIPIVLNCTLVSISSISNTTNINRQPPKFYWMRNIKEMYLNLRLPTNKTEQIATNLIEFHSCKRLSYSARTIIQQIKPILLVYYLEEHKKAFIINAQMKNIFIQQKFNWISIIILKKIIFFIKSILILLAKKKTNE